MAEKVLHIIGRSSYDGTCTYALRMASALGQYDCELLFKTKGKAFDEIKKTGLRIYHLSDGDKDKSFSGILLSVITFFLRRRYDKIHYHSGGSLLLLIAWFFRRGARVIHHIHCGNLDCSKDGEKISLLNKAIYKILNNRTFKITAADHIAQNYRANIGKSYKLSTIKNTVPFDFKRKSSLKKKIGYIGQISKDKGFDHILSIFKNSEYTLVVKGDNYYNINFSDYYGNVHFIEPTLRLDEFFEQIDLLLFPSQAAFEGMPLVVLEAMAFDVGVIAQRTKAVGEILGDYPLYAGTFTKEDVIRKLSEFYSEGYSRVLLSEMHSEICKKHSFDEMIKKITSVYQR